MRWLRRFVRKSRAESELDTGLQKENVYLQEEISQEHDFDALHSLTILSGIAKPSGFQHLCSRPLSRCLIRTPRERNFARWLFMSARALLPLLSIRVTPGRSTTNSRSGCEWRASSQWKPRSAIIADMLSQGANPEEILEGYPAQIGTRSSLLRSIF